MQIRQKKTRNPRGGLENPIQGYLAHQKPLLPRVLEQASAQDRTANLRGGILFYSLMSEVPLYLNPQSAVARTRRLSSYTDILGGI